MRGTRGTDSRVNLQRDVGSFDSLYCLVVEVDTDRGEYSEIHSFFGTGYFAYVGSKRFDFFITS